MHFGTRRIEKSTCPALSIFLIFFSTSRVINRHSFFSRALRHCAWAIFIHNGGWDFMPVKGRPMHNGVSRFLFLFFFYCFASLFLDFRRRDEKEKKKKREKKGSKRYHIGVSFDSCLGFLVKHRKDAQTLGNITSQIARVCWESVVINSEDSRRHTCEP